MNIVENRVLVLELISKLKETDYKKLHLKDTFFIGYCIEELERNKDVYNLIITLCQIIQVKDDLINDLLKTGTFLPITNNHAPITIN